MHFIETLALAVALGCDAFAVGLALGALHHAPAQVFRLSFSFGFFQFAMPLIGWWLGGHVSTFAQEYAPWIAFGLLFIIGVNMIRSSLSPGKKRDKAGDPTKGWSLMALSVATSIDALGVGISLGVMGRPVLGPALIIGLVAAAMTLGAIKLASLVSPRFALRMELVGGLVLIAIGIKAVAG